jgi:hypothetical protein
MIRRFSAMYPLSPSCPKSPQVGPHGSEKGRAPPSEIQVLGPLRGVWQRLTATGGSLAELALLVLEARHLERATKLRP